MHWVKIIIHIHPYPSAYNFKIFISRSKKFWMDIIRSNWMDIIDIHYEAIQLSSLPVRMSFFFSKINKYDESKGSNFHKNIMRVNFKFFFQLLNN